MRTLPADPTHYSCLSPLSAAQHQSRLQTVSWSDGGVDAVIIIYNERDTEAVGQTGA